MPMLASPMLGQGPRECRVSQRDLHLDLNWRPAAPSRAARRRRTLPSVPAECTAGGQAQRCCAEPFCLSLHRAQAPRAALSHSHPILLSLFQCIPLLRSSFSVLDVDHKSPVLVHIITVAYISFFALTKSPPPLVPVARSPAPVHSSHTLAL